MGLLGNVAEVQNLRCKLMVAQYIKVFRSVEISRVLIMYIVPTILSLLQQPVGQYQ